MALTTPLETRGPLSGITVVDLTRVLAGPFCTMVLLDLGARIIKVEQPETGDEARGIGPFIGSVSGYFASVNRGKESITLDLKNPDDREVLHAVLTRADILIENFRPGVMDRLDLGWEQLKETYPALIYTSVSGFGHTGPYRDYPAYDLVVQAMGGMMSLTGHPDGAPTRVGSSMGDITAALFAAIGICSALYDRSVTGKGQKIDIGMLDCQVAILENAIVRHSATGEIPQALGSRHPSIVPFDAFRSADGHIVIAAGNDTLFTRLCTALDRPDLPTDERFSINSSRARHVEELTQEMNAVLQTRNTDHWLAVLRGSGVPCGAINTVDQVVADAHVNARNMIVESNDPVEGTIRLAGNPVKFSTYADSGVRGTVPRLGEHRDAIIAEVSDLLHVNAGTDPGS